MFSVVVHLVELVSNHMLRWIGLKLVTMWIAQKCISVNTRIHIQSGLKLVRICSVNRPLVSQATPFSAYSAKLWLFPELRGVCGKGCGLRDYNVAERVSTLDLDIIPVPIVCKSKWLPNPRSRTLRVKSTILSKVLYKTSSVPSRSLCSSSHTRRNAVGTTSHKKPINVSRDNLAPCAKKRISRR